MPRSGQFSSALAMVGTSDMSVARSFLDQPEHGRRIEAPHHHLLAAEHGGGLRTSPAVGVKQRDGVQLDQRLSTGSLNSAHGQRVQVERAVGEHHAFGRAGAAAGIEEFGDRVLVEAERSRRARRGRARAALRNVRSPCGDLSSSATKCRMSGQDWPELLHERREIVFVNQHARAGMIQDADQFRRA